LDFANANPDIFHGNIRVPGLVEAVSIGRDVDVVDNTIRIEKMGEHGAALDVGVSEFGVFEDREVDLVHSLEELVFELGGYLEVKLVLGDVLVVEPIDLGDLGPSCAGGMDGGGAWMDGNNEGFASTIQVCGGGHKHGQVAVGTASTSRMDGDGVGVKFFLQREKRYVGWFALDRS